MQKKLIALAVAGALAAPMLAQATELSITGDSRIRFADTTMTDETGAGAADTVSASTNSRVRVAIKATTDDGATVNVRLKQDSFHGDAAQTGLVGDYGYLSVPVGPVVLSGGIMVGNWGHKVLYWDTRPNRFMISGKTNGWMLGLAFDKMTENYSGTNDTAGDDDVSSTKLLAKGKAGPADVGVLYEMRDNGEAADKDGTIIDVYFTTPAGPATVIGEYVTRSGTSFENAAKDAGNGLLLGAVMNFGAIDATFLYANTTGGFTMGKYVAPYSTVGTWQDTAFLDFGGTETATLLGVVAGMNVAENLRGQFGFGQVSMDNYGGGSTDATAIDLQAVYTVSKSATITATYGTLNVDDFSDMTAMGARMEVSF